MQVILDQHKIDANFVIIGLDPKSDKPADWRDYRAMRHITRNNWQFLSGSPTGIKDVAGQLGINYWSYHEHILHDFMIVLLDSEGNIIKK